MTRVRLQILISDTAISTHIQETGRYHDTFLELSGALLSAGQSASATPLLQELQGMHWSATLYPDMHVILK